MSVVGPRPEDMVNVERYYGDLGWQTLTVRPGLAGVSSSIYNYTHGENMLVGDNPEQIYAEDLLPVKLALEVVYLRQPTLGYDVRLIFRTLQTIVQIASGRQEFADPPEMAAARTVTAGTNGRASAHRTRSGRHSIPRCCDRCPGARASCGFAAARPA